MYWYCSDRHKQWANCIGIESPEGNLDWSTLNNDQMNGIPENWMPVGEFIKQFFSWMLHSDPRSPILDTVLFLFLSFMDRSNTKPVLIKSNYNFKRTVAFYRTDEVAHMLLNFKHINSFHWSNGVRLFDSYFLRLNCYFIVGKILPLPSIWISGYYGHKA